MKKVSVSVSNGVISRTAKIPNEDKFNNPKKYITLTKDSNIHSDLKKVLDNFQEFRNGLTATITNTGLVWFSGAAAYDLTETEVMTWEAIDSDFSSTVEFYTEYNNPLAFRKLRIAENSSTVFVGDVFVKKGDQYLISIDCDKIGDVSPSSDGTYTLNNYKFQEVKFEYKQYFRVIAYNCVANSIKVKGNGDEVTINFKNNLAEIDCSNFKRTPFITISVVATSVNENSYVEVF